MKKTTKKRIAIGIRVHSGWGALVAVSGELGSEEIVARERITIADPRTPGATQPYHFAQKLSRREDEKSAEQHIKKCARTSVQMALAAVRKVVEGLRDRDCNIIGATILLGSGRPLPPFGKILASHPLLHSAEGVFFRQAFREALELLAIPVTGIPERKIEERVAEVFGKKASGLQRRVAEMGRSIGPPWTLDQKTAALGAWIVLAGTKS